MNISQFRNKLKKLGVDFALGKDTCYLIYKGVIIMTCERNKQDIYSAIDGVVLLKEIKYADSYLHFHKIISIIRYPIRSYKRIRKGYDII